MKKKVKNYKLATTDLKNSEKNFEEVWDRLVESYPDAHCALNHRNAFELLIATILSAQCTDKRVNMVTPELFRQFPSPQKMAKASQLEMENLIKSTGFYRNKAKNIIACAKKIVSDFGGEVPKTMTELITLPGAARKTANVVLWNAYGINDGVVVDTHVGRLSKRLGWSGQENPAKIEQDLMKLIPQDKWGHSSHLLIEHGRQLCKAISPQCKNCFLVDLCPWFKKVISKK